MNIAAVTKSTFRESTTAALFPFTNKRNERATLQFQSSYSKWVKPHAWVYFHP